MVMPWVLASIFSPILVGVLILVLGGWIEAPAQNKQSIEVIHTVNAVQDNRLLVLEESMRSVAKKEDIQNLERLIRAWINKPDGE